MAIIQIDARTGSIKTIGSHKKYTGESVPGEFAYWQTYSPDPNQFISDTYSDVSDRSTSLYHISSFARSRANKPVSYIIGTGLIFKSAIPNQKVGMTREDAEAWSQDYTDYLDEEKRRLNYYSLESLVARELIVSGEVVVYISRDEAGKIESISAQPGVSAIEPEKKSDIEMIFNGVQTNQNYKPIAIYRRDGKKMDLSNTPGQTNVIYIRHVERPEQVRGLSKFYTEISRARNHERIWDGTTEKIIQEANHVMVTDNPGGLTNSESPLIRKKEKNIAQKILHRMRGTRPGTVIELQTNGNLKPLPALTPSNNFGTANDWLLNMFSMSTGYPPEFLMGKYSTSFTAHKGALNDAWTQIVVDRAEISTQLSDIVNRELLFSSDIDFDRSIYWQFLKGNYIGPTLKHINPKVEVAADIAAVNAGFIPRSDIAQKYGIDYVNSADKMKRDEKLHKEITGEDEI